MITYSPRYIVAAAACGTSIYGEGHPTDYLPLYEHFARRVLDERLPYEILVDTSGINYGEFARLSSQADAATILAKLLASAGTDSPRGKFLRQCGIRRWADLAKPIRIHGWACKEQIEHDVRERRLREPGPNEYHPGAVFGQTCYYQFDRDRKWTFVFRYGYSHDSSSWDIYVWQRREALSTFVRQTVPRWLDETLEPEQWDTARTHANREYDRLASAVDTLFSPKFVGRAGTSITERLVQEMLDQPRRPYLTPRRLGALRRWAREDAVGRPFGYTLGDTLGRALCLAGGAAGLLKKGDDDEQ